MLFRSKSAEAILVSWGMAEFKGARWPGISQMHHNFGFELWHGAMHAGCRNCTISIGSKHAVP